MGRIGGRLGGRRTGFAGRAGAGIAARRRRIGATRSRGFRGARRGLVRRPITGFRRVGRRAFRIRLIDYGCTRHHMRTRYRGGFIRGGYYRRGRYRYRGPILYFNYGRWNRVHHYNPPEEEIMFESYDSYRKQLPPDGDNFVFVPLLNIPNSDFSNITLPATEMARKIEPHEFRTYVHNIINAWKKAP